MSTCPRVSVVMPAFNAEKYIGEAIESILAQTLSDFEFIIINDGSTDSTSEILDSYRARDPRIRVHTQDNCGTASAMNAGCQLACGKYVARMDADDISLPQRLERQVNYLEQKPELSICGTWMRTLGEGESKLVRYPDDPDVALSTLPFKLPIVGGSLMFMRTLYSEKGVRYNPHVGATDDYLFVIDCSKYCQLASIPEVLYHYRRHATQVTSTQRERQHHFARQIRLQQLEELGIQPSEDEIDTHEAICTWDLEGDQVWVEKTEKWLAKMKLTNVRKQKYPQEAFARVLSDYWFAVCTRNAHLGLWAYRTFYNSQLSADRSLETGRKLKFLAKCTMYLPTDSLHLRRRIAHRN